MHAGFDFVLGGDLRDERAITYAAVIERRFARDCFAMAPPEIVENHDTLAGPLQALYRDASDVAGAAGYENRHAYLLRLKARLNLGGLALFFIQIFYEEDFVLSFVVDELVHELPCH